MIEIDKGIPVPKETSGRGRKCIYPWDSMEVGDSFFVADGKKGKNAAWERNRKFNQTEFVTATEKDGVRVWRVK